MITILIPTYNNLDYLKLCIKSIKNNSSNKYKIILHINEGTDGTLDYANENNLEYTFSKTNIGLCASINNSCKLVKTKYILYAHDDMYFCPEWDIHLINEINKIGHDKFYLSAVLIGYLEHIRFNCGDTINEFNEDKLLKNYKKKNFYDYQGSHYAPHLVSKRIWDKVGGFSEEFYPGVASDPDFNMKLWKEGVRIFKGINNFKVYHFVSTVIKRINVPTKNEPNIKSKAHKIFLLKWGVSINFFKKFYLNTNSEYLGPLKDPKKNIKFIFNYFLCKIKYLYVRLLYNKLYSKN